MLLSGERLHGIERSLTELKAFRRQLPGEFSATGMDSWLRLRLASLYHVLR